MRDSGTPSLGTSPRLVPIEDAHLCTLCNECRSSSILVRCVSDGKRGDGDDVGTAPDGDLAPVRGFAANEYVATDTQRHVPNDYG